MQGPWERAPHTAAKHSIYHSYLDAWFPILANRFPQITYAEGFAGCGIYTEGEPGSPVIALGSFLRRRSEFTRLRHARFLFVEKERHNATLLAREIGHLLKERDGSWDYNQGGLEVRIRCGRCEDELPRLLDQTGAWRQPILAVFDTFGGGVPRDLLERVANNPSSEVIYTVLPQHFIRFPDQDRGDQVFGDAEWRRVAELAPSEKQEYITDKFSSTLQRAGFSYTLRFDLVTAQNDVLNLLFGTSSDKGVEKFKDALWRADQVRGASFKDPRDPRQQMLAMQHEPALDPLCRILYAHLADRVPNGHSVTELRDFTLRHTIFKPSHVSKALKRLQRDNLIRATDDANPRFGTTRVEAVPTTGDLFAGG